MHGEKRHEFLQYADIIWQPSDLVEIRPLPPNSGQRAWVYVKDLATQIDRIQDENSRGVNIYAGVLPRTMPGGGSAEHTNGGRILWIDCDKIGAEIALNLVRQSGSPQPIMAASSEHGAHIYWKLDSKLQREEHSRLLKAIYYYLKDIPELTNHLDSTTQEPARILRLPGFINHKPPIVNCRIVYSNPDAISRQDEWQKVLTKASPPRTQGRATNSSDQSKVKNNAPVCPQTPFRPGTEDDRDRKYALSALQKETDMVASMAQGNRNNTLNNAAISLGHYVGGGCLDESEVYAALMQAARQCGLSENETQNTIRSGITAGKREPKRAPLLDSKIDPGVNLSGILKQKPRDVTNKNNIVTIVNGEVTDKNPTDPGMLPDSFYRIPGFISDVMDFTLEVTPAPNEILAFCGALVLQAHLAGRKVRDPGNIRTNIYILALANPGAGKDWPRKINNQIMHEIEAGGQIANRWSSDEGIQDALIKDKAVLF